METFESLEKYEDFSEAEERAKQTKGISIEYIIGRKENGKYVVVICMDEVYDGLTKEVFVVTEKETRVREVKTQDENTYYEDAEKTTHSIEFGCNSFTEAKEKVAEIIEKIAENRKKVRRIENREIAYVVF
jgi:hypothetical protein